MLKVKAGVWAGIVIFFITLVFFIQSLQFSYLGPLGPGPGFFPSWISGILLLLSVLYIYESVKKENDAKEEQGRSEGLKNILFILVSMVIFILLLMFLGFVLSTTIFLFVLLFREYRWYSSLGIAFGAAMFLFWLFGSILNVSLPVNAFGW